MVFGLQDKSFSGTLGNRIGIYNMLGSGIRPVTVVGHIIFILTAVGLLYVNENLNRQEHFGGIGPNKPSGWPAADFVSRLHRECLA